MAAFGQLLHSRLLLTLVLGFGGLGLWGLVNAARGSARSPYYLGALLVGELTLALEGALGLALLLGGAHPVRLDLHLVYGAAALLALPAAFIYTDRHSARQRHAVFGLTCLMVCALVLRGQATGRAGP